ncbi:cytochrome P450 [Streptomyces sp. NPDC008343]|uniref:cytochrome P450 n=1 Tax=Streptomyces sp. NPDC008343 TaxID=3364828 RepID=UPI0036EAA04A
MISTARSSRDLSSKKTMSSLLSNATNRDLDHFADPDALDLTRSPAGHLTFGHGLHRCLGQRLAPAEIRIALPALLRRFPVLRLTVAPEEGRCGRP